LTFDWHHIIIINMLRLKRHRQAATAGDTDSMCNDAFCRLSAMSVLPKKQPQTVSSGSCRKTGTVNNKACLHRQRKCKLANRKLSAGGRKAHQYGTR